MTGDVRSIVQEAVIGAAMVVLMVVVGENVEMVLSTAFVGDGPPLPSMCQSHHQGDITKTIYSFKGLVKY